MTHEITENDQIVLHRTGAWHGYGKVVDTALSPTEAAAMAELDYTIEQRPLFAKVETADIYIPVHSHVANYRQDTGELFAVVSSSYQVVQPAVMAEFCDALSEEGGVKVETAGSILGGKKLWFLLRGETVEIGKGGDVIYLYCLVSNGHDGITLFRVTPTTIRVVCSNTLHSVVPKFDSGTLGKSAIAIRHTANVMSRIEEAKIALAQYTTAQNGSIELFNRLAAKDVSKENVQQFFLECYTADFGAIPDNPQNKWEERRREKAKSAYHSFSRRFDEDRQVAGTSWWNTFNAYSGMLQHDQKARGKDDTARVERRIDSNLFGLNQDRTQNALRLAFKMSTV